MANREAVIQEGLKYRQNDFPLDSLQIDVDIQNQYRTFTVDEQGVFPNPKDMFGYLRTLGIKCGTNITPVISNTGYGDYTIYLEGIKPENKSVIPRWPSFSIRIILTLYWFTDTLSWTNAKKINT